METEDQNCNVRGLDRGRIVGEIVSGASRDLDLGCWVSYQ